MTWSTRSDGDFSMWAYWRNGERLVTRELVLEVAAHLVRNKCGQEDLDQQLPFCVSETETEWAIMGSKVISERPRPGEGPIFGKVEIKISKQNCQILSFMIHAEFAVSD